MTAVIRKNILAFDPLVVYIQVWGACFAVSLDRLKKGEWQDSEALSAQEARKIAMSSDASFALCM